MRVLIIRVTMPCQQKLSILSHPDSAVLLTGLKVHSGRVCLILFFYYKDTPHRLGEFWCPQVPFIDSSASYLGETRKCLQIKLTRFFRHWNRELPCARLQPALCTRNYSLWKEKRRFLVYFPSFCTAHFLFFFFSILFLSLSCLAASCLLTMKLSGVERIQVQTLDVATVLGHQTFYHEFKR